MVYFDLDTDDYALTKPEQLGEAIQNVDDALKDADPEKDGFLAIAHDIHEQSATKLTEYMLEVMEEKGYKAVTVGECLGDPEVNWYRGGKYGPGGEGENESEEKDAGEQSSSSQKATKSAAAANESGSPDAGSISSSTAAASSSSTAVDSGTRGRGVGVVITRADTLEAESKKSSSMGSNEDSSDGEAGNASNAVSVSDNESTSEEEANDESTASRSLSKFGVAAFAGPLIFAALM